MFRLPREVAAIDLLFVRKGGRLNTAHRTRLTPHKSPATRSWIGSRTKQCCSRHRSTHLLQPFLFPCVMIANAVLVTSPCVLHSTDESSDHEIRGGAETAARVRGRGQCAWNSVVGVFAPGMHVLCRSTYIVYLCMLSTVQVDSIRKTTPCLQLPLNIPERRSELIGTCIATFVLLTKFLANQGQQYLAL